MGELSVEGVDWSRGENVSIWRDLKLPNIPKGGVKRVLSHGLEDHEGMLKDSDWILCYDHGLGGWVLRVSPEARRRVLGLHGYVAMAVMASNRGPGSSPKGSQGI